MAEASETPNTVTGTNVAVGNNTTMNISYNGMPQIPRNLPPGSRVQCTCTYQITVGDPSGAASGEEQQQQQQQRQNVPSPSQQQEQQAPPQPQQNTPQQRPRPPPRKRSSQQQHHQQQQQQQNLQLAGSQQQQQMFQQKQDQSRCQTQPPVPEEHIRQQRQSQQPQQETSPPGQHPSASRGQPQGQWGSIQPLQAFTSQASYSVELGTGLPYSMKPLSDYPAMPVQLQTASGNTGSAVEERDDVGYRPALHRSLTHPAIDDNTMVKRPNSPFRSISVCDSATHCDQSPIQGFQYSLNPRDCPTGPCTESLKTSLRALPKSEKFSPQLPIISTSTDKDAKTPELTDIIAITISSQLVLVVSDMANSCIKVLKDIHDTHPKVECLRFTSPPTSLSRIKGDNILVSCYQEMQFLIVNIGQMTIRETIKTSRQYTGFDSLNDTALAACYLGSVDVIDHKGNLLKSYSLTHPNSPCYISASSRIYVTDSMANTLTCLDHQGQVKFSVTASELSKVSVLRGLVQCGSDILVADDTGERILSFADTGKTVKVVLDKMNGISKPRGLCIHDNSLYIAEKGGAIRVWKMPGITSTRL